MHYIANPVKVQAWSIVGVADKANEDGSLNVILDAKNENEESLVVIATKEMMSRMTPKAGDYWVVQEDGYTYLNPKDVFEKKYRLDEVINPEDKIAPICKDFEEVLRELGAQEKDVKGPFATRELALSSTNLDLARMWVREHVERNL